jgi:hypothetical protein
MYSILQMSSFFQSEWSAVLALLIIAVIYFLVPVAGYLPNKRGTLLAAMWAIVIKLGISLFRSGFWALQMMQGGPRPAPFTRPGFGMAGGLLATFEESLGVLLPLGESVVFLAAMVLFVLGLQRLRRPEQIYRLQ